MTAKNLAIVWAPNLLRSAPPSTPTSSEVGAANAQAPTMAEEHARLQQDLVQNTQIVHYLIRNASWLFDSNNNNNGQGQGKKQVTSAVTLTSTLRQAESSSGDSGHFDSALSSSSSPSNPSSPLNSGSLRTGGEVNFVMTSQRDEDSSSSGFGSDDVIVSSSGLGGKANGEIKCDILFLVM